MRARACSIALGCLCFLLAACGGGGGGGSSGVVPSTAHGAGASAATSSPTPASSPATYPTADGDQLLYAGTLTQSFQSFPEIVAPGTPSPEPTSQTAIDVTESVQVKSDQAFAGTQGLYDLHATETDAYVSGLKTTTSQSDTYEAVTANGADGSRLLSYGTQFTDESGDSITTTYAPSRILDELPQTPGAQWSNPAGATIQEALAGDASGSAITVARTVNGDGSYSESTTYPPGYSAPNYTGVGQISENRDGSGSFAWVANASATTILYSVPVPQPSGPPLITISVYGGLDPTPADQPANIFQMPTWYGSAPALYNESDRDDGVVAVPASCKLAAQFPQQATEVLRTIDRVDTVLGYTEHETAASYVAAGYGALCTQLSDTQSLYYDFNGDQPFVFTQQPPLEIATTSETLALQPGTYVSSAARRHAETSAPVGGHLDIAATLRASFDHRVSALRAARITRAIRTLRTLLPHGGAR